MTAWYLLAADTIDERIAALIDHKRAVVGSVTEGTAGLRGRQSSTACCAIWRRKTRRRKPPPSYRALALR